LGDLDESHDCVNRSVEGRGRDERGALAFVALDAVKVVRVSVSEQDSHYLTVLKYCENVFA
jgi:hypothetical protein